MNVPAMAQRGRNRSGERPQEQAPTTQESGFKQGEPQKDVADKLSTTDGQVTIQGQALKYTATAGRLVLRDDSGKARAEMFFVAYQKEPASEDLSRRPITFLFNGGPGSSSVWLHMGAAGPKRVALDDNGSAPQPPYHLVDNEQTWLPYTDLVFIDPVGTGYSRAAPGVNPQEFFGVENDLRSVAQFIRLYTTRYNRWLSPKFVGGESYGTTRASALSNVLLEEGISLNGVILISCVLNFQTLSFAKGNDISYVLYLPTYTAVAWYHKKLAGDLQSNLQKAIEESEQFALHDYMTDLAAGVQIDPKEREKAVKELARLTALPEKLIDRANLRVDPSEFRKELLADDRKVLGRYDARITGYDQDPTATRPEYDPSYEPYLGAYSAVFNDYVRRVLKFESDLPYEVLSSNVRPWNMGPAGSGYLNVAERLNTSLIESPNLRVLFNSGYFDLATPFLATKYTVSHLDVNPAERRDITQAFYDSGHMIYHHRPDREKLVANVAAFIKAAIPNQQEQVPGVAQAEK